MNQLSKSQKILLSVLFSLFVVVGIALVYVSFFFDTEVTEISQNLPTPSNNENNEDLNEFPSSDGTITLEFPTEEKVTDSEFGQVYYQNYPEQDIFYENVLKGTNQKLFDLFNVRDFSRAEQVSDFSYSPKRDKNIVKIDQNGNNSVIKDPFLEQSNSAYLLNLSSDGSKIAFKAISSDSNFIKTGIGSFENNTISYLKETADFISWQDNTRFFYQLSNEGGSELLLGEMGSNGTIESDSIIQIQDLADLGSEWQFSQALYSPDERYLYVQVGLGSFGPVYEEYRQFIIDVNSNKTNTLSTTIENFKIDDLLFDSASKNILYAYSTDKQSSFETLNIQLDKVIAKYTTQENLSEVSLGLVDNNTVLVQDKDIYGPVRKTYKFTFDLNDGLISQFIGFEDRGIHIF